MRPGASLPGVLYAEDFDEPAPPPSRPPAKAAAAAQPELIVPTYSLAELRAAAERGHQEGRETERRDAAASATAQGAAALTALARQIDATQQQATRVVDQALQALATTTLSLLAAAVPELCRRHSQLELHALMRRVLPPMRQMPSLSIRLNPAVRAALEDQVGTLLLDSGTQVTWIEAPALPPGDIAITWQNGSALRDTASISRDISTAVLSMLEPQTTDMLEPPDDE